MSGRQLLGQVDDGRGRSAGVHVATAERGAWKPTLSEEQVGVCWADAAVVWGRGTRGTSVSWPCRELGAGPMLHVVEGNLPCSHVWEPKARPGRSMVVWAFASKGGKSLRCCAGRAWMRWASLEQSAGEKERQTRC